MTPPSRLISFDILPIWTGWNWHAVKESLSKMKAYLAWRICKVLIWKSARKLPMVRFDTWQICNIWISIGASKSPMMLFDIWRICDTWIRKTAFSLAVRPPMIPFDKFAKQALNMWQCFQTTIKDDAFSTFDEFTKLEYGTLPSNYDHRWRLSTFDEFAKFYVSLNLYHIPRFA